MNGSQENPQPKAEVDEIIVTEFSRVKVTEAAALPSKPISPPNPENDEASDDEGAEHITTHHIEADTVGEERDESKFLDDVDPDCPELDLTHCRLTDMKALGLERFSRLERLGMRQNLFARIEGIQGLAPRLIELDLYDNRISKFDTLADFERLVSLDLSFNKIKRIPPNVLSKMSKLKDLYFVANKISVIEHLEGLVSLTNLELGSNRIREIQNLQAVRNLRQLWLGKNKITSLAGLEALQNLELLSIQSNRIVDLKGIDALPNLEELYISHNGILKIDHLGNCPKLRVLDLCNNRISVLENVAHLSTLEEFWISNNHLSDWKAVEEQTKGLSKLETIYLEGNPLQRESGAHYRLKIKTLIPHIKQIDSTYCR